MCNGEIIGVRRGLFQFSTRGENDEVRASRRGNLEISGHGFQMAGVLLDGVVNFIAAWLTAALALQVDGPLVEAVAANDLAGNVLDLDYEDAFACQKQGINLDGMAMATRDVLVSHQAAIRNGFEGLGDLVFSRLADSFILSQSCLAPIFKLFGDQ
ncbi:hypothetical protein CE91St35_15470 [Eggerthella lenta]|nr:hypothetical protein CE91St34_06640 [Eggerthella lenta]GKG87393.1 hypothetical protein CE91St35_15470 [Eggerthella lenta]